jgi:hypothetical protein
VWFAKLICCVLISIARQERNIPIVLRRITSFRQSHDRLMTQIQEAETEQEMAGYRFWKSSRSGGNTLKVVPSSQAIRREPFFGQKIADSTYLRKLESRFGPKLEENQAHKTNPNGAR